MSSQTTTVQLKSIAGAHFKNTIFSRNSTIYKDLVISKVLSQAKFQVFLGKVSSSSTKVAVKIFPFQDQQPDINYLNEVKFAHLRHENVISILHHEQEKLAVYNDHTCRASYTVMELAPHGDFFDFVISGKVKMHEKLARTLFHQLIAGIEYLHSVGVAHMDLKLENLLLGEDYKLKIGDFDQAFIIGKSAVMTRGTVNYRAPEQMERRCKNPKAVDIYSAGIILFAMQSGGFIPYSEEEEGQELTMLELMGCNPKLFWKKHSEVQEEGSTVFNDEFKTLFMGMTAFHSETRMTIQQIKESKWYQGAVYSQSELESILKKFY